MSRDRSVFAKRLEALTPLFVKKGLKLLGKKDPEQAAGLAEWLKELTGDEFKGRVLPINVHTAKSAASLHASKPRPLLDSFIAATALEHNLILATRNTPDFLESGISVVNPWEPGSPVTVLL